MAALEKGGPMTARGIVNYISENRLRPVTGETPEATVGAVLYTAIQMRMKQEDNVNDLRFELEKMERELQDLADRRDLARPAHAVDVEAISASNQPWWF